MRKDCFRSSCVFQLRGAKLASCLLPLALFTMLAVGCGKGGDTVQVNGHVTYRGQAIPNGSLTFFPPTGRPVVAPLTQEGDYMAELTPGDYVAAVMVGSVLPEGYKEGDRLPPQSIVLPAEYTSRSKSTLKTTVSPGQSEPVNFELK